MPRTNGDPLVLDRHSDRFIESLVLLQIGQEESQRKHCELKCSKGTQSLKSKVILAVSTKDVKNVAGSRGGAEHHF